ncbi:hypothetical protein BX600DRAFT_99396 [Xylariales sp. PMI_506]|nr:hypothetical protein BX600DRAFT_99396 [Xylariales sp. PMI_506]
MVSFAAKLALPALIVLGAVFVQLELPRILRLALGIGRTLDPLDAFPYQCRRVYNKGLEACEDMWLSESTRQLFLACSNPLKRDKWLPNMGHYDVEGRSLNDAMLVIDIDSPNWDVTEPRVLETPGFFGTNGDGRLYLVGFGGVDDKDGEIRLWVINVKPSVDLTTGEFSDNYKTGGNTTVELFRTGPKATKLDHVKTFWDSQIVTPNRIAPVGGETNAFYFTNDHGTHKPGLRSIASPYLGTGDVSFCDDSSCKEVVSGQNFPNGLAAGPDGLIYVPSSILGDVRVYQPQPGGDLKKIDHIPVDYNLDNLAVDGKGDVYAAAIVDIQQFFKAQADPYHINAPSAGIRISRNSKGAYELSKVIEDGLGEILPPTTTVLHDAKTGRLFLTGVSSPYIAVCDPK